MKAYPHSKHFSDSHSNDFMNGMDLRDFFAAQALPELLRWDLALPIERQNGLKWLSAYSFKIADAMMEARHAK